MKKRPAISHFSKRLDACLTKGGLSVANLAVWFDRPYPTIHSWVYDKRQPAPQRGMMTEISRRLRLMEKIILDGVDLPIPHHIVQPKRNDYVRLIFRKHDEYTRFS